MADKFTAASAYNDWFATLIILVMGPGYFAVDTILSKFVDKKAPTPLPR